MMMMMMTMIQVRRLPTPSARALFLFALLAFLLVAVHAEEPPLTLLADSEEATDDDAAATSKCVCSPTMYSFQLDFSLTCTDTSIMAATATAVESSQSDPKADGAGISNVTCGILAMSPDAFQVQDLVPTLITSMDIYELDQNGILRVQQAIQGPIRNTDVVHYKSYVTDQDDDDIMAPNEMPKSITVSLVGVNTANRPIANVFVVEFNNKCNGMPVLKVNQTIGWTRVVDVGEPNDDLCFVAETTKAPASPGICTLDVQQCEDGSYVSRRPEKNCEFAPCPDTDVEIVASRNEDSTTEEEDAIKNKPVTTKNNNSTDKTNEPKNETMTVEPTEPLRQGCTKDIRLCEDGSAVGRDPELGCAFTPCRPTAIESNITDVELELPTFEDELDDITFNNAKNETSTTINTRMVKMPKIPKKPRKPKIPKWTKSDDGKGGKKNPSSKSDDGKGGKKNPSSKSDDGKGGKKSSSSKNDDGKGGKKNQKKMDSKADAANPMKRVRGRHLASGGF